MSDPVQPPSSVFEPPPLCEPVSPEELAKCKEMLRLNGFRLQDDGALYYLYRIHTCQYFKLVTDPFEPEERGGGLGNAYREAVLVMGAIVHSEK